MLYFLYFPSYIIQKEANIYELFVNIAKVFRKTQFPTFNKKEFLTIFYFFTYL